MRQSYSFNPPCLAPPSTPHIQPTVRTGHIGMGGQIVGHSSSILTQGTARMPKHHLIGSMSPASTAYVADSHISYIAPSRVECLCWLVTWSLLRGFSASGQTIGSVWMRNGQLFDLPCLYGQYAVSVVYGGGGGCQAGWVEAIALTHHISIK